MEWRFLSLSVGWAVLSGGLIVVGIRGLVGARLAALLGVGSALLVASTIYRELRSASVDCHT